jgi:type IV secretory pathway VirB10-like protein
MLRTMRAVLVVVSIGAVAAIAWLLFEARALRTPAPSPPITVAPPPPAPSPPPPPAAPPPPPPATPPSLAAEMPDTSPGAAAIARVRVESVLSAVTRLCPLPHDADRREHLVVRITAGGDRVQSLEHVDGELPADITECIDKHLRLARWPPLAAPVTFDLPVRAGDLIQ